MKSSLPFSPFSYCHFLEFALPILPFLFYRTQTFKDTTTLLCFHHFSCTILSCLNYLKRINGHCFLLTFPTASGTCYSSVICIILSNRSTFWANDAHLYSPDSFHGSNWKNLKNALNVTPSNGSDSTPASLNIFFASSTGYGSKYTTFLIPT